MNFLEWLTSRLRSISVPSRNALFHALDESSLAHSDAAARALQSGCEPRLVFRCVDDIESWRGVYSRRAKGLKARNSSPHALQLVRCTEEAVLEMERRHPKALMILEIPHPKQGQYNVWLDIKDRSPIGCLFTISQLKVSRDEWREIWGQQDDEEWERLHPHLD